ncbi:hypothetical protein E0H22_04800 [Rhodopseudomonas boonkerdii]|uniref:AAA family ATPase n=1 Tax=Rhodopseudomonas boonkerdii TaxID=475937 RepID=UPI001E48A170|nr:AAA family ATPase [Rhodopseudomonas boonkerdii]UGV25054.1 hypothetical protein E0H22_04800 [Rhodopseudomonas boonkerdii]
MKRLLLISGPIAAGKSAIAANLIEQHGFLSIRSGGYLKELAESKGIGSSRADLQVLGDELDAATDYRWLIDDIAAKIFEKNQQQDFWLFDSVRKHRQVLHFKNAYKKETLHVHLTAPESILKQRYEKRSDTGGEYSGATPYGLARIHPNEIASRSLIEIADFIFDVSQTPPEKTATEIIKNWNAGGV